MTTALDLAVLSTVTDQFNIPVVGRRSSSTSMTAPTETTTGGSNA